MTMAPRHVILSLRLPILYKRQVTWTMSCRLMDVHSNECTL